MKKRLLMTTVLLVITLSVSWAQDATQRLVVWQKSGEKTYIDLTDEPETTFEDSKLVIITKTTTIDFHLSNIQRYTYEGNHNWNKCLSTVFFTTRFLAST